MSTKSHLFRMTIDIPADDHKRLKALAAVLGKSMREIVSEWIHGNLRGGKKPNAATMKAIKNIENGKNLIQAKDTEDLFRKLGI
jgi:hypothetical protein